MQEGGIHKEVAIHIELNLICLIILFAVAIQSHQNVNQQMKRVLFRNVVYGIMCSLSLDIIWLLIDGRIFPGCYALNAVVNAAFLGAGVCLGSMWYLYVLDTLHYRMTKRLIAIVMAPGILFLVLNFLSIWTGWIFYINEQNRYIRGPLFWFQSIGAIAMLLVSLVHIIYCQIVGRKGVSKDSSRKLLGFYIIPVLGTIMAWPYSGMPGTWTCAAVSVVLIYMNDMDQIILTDDLTGLNNRKNLRVIFEDYSKQHSAQKPLYLYMMDLDDFKQINDQLGHSVGDQALVEAAHVIRRQTAGIQAVVMRYGGDEFLVMGFFADDAGAQRYKEQMQKAFQNWNETHHEPYVLHASVGYSRYQPGQKLEEFINSADEMLYNDKRKQKDKRKAA
ncbi:MAG: GGDEF domain-containing protein [Solobacterium sp.]|nr:GGDEF domain-containing protein [Solobacterium sp.]